MTTPSSQKSAFQEPPSQEPPSQKPMSKHWHWHPDLPIPVSPIMSWPPRPLATLRWIASYWLVISAVTLEFACAWLIFAFLQPDLATMKTLEWGWMVQLWGRNMLLLLVVAGSLHLWFYRFQGQQKQRKFDPRDLARSNRKFWFGDQVKDNMFFSLGSGVLVWSLFEIGYFWAAANGHMPMLVWADNPFWFALWFVLIPIWSSFHFYVIHRLLHWQPLYKLAHGLHHRNINVGPWSGISMHPIEHILYFSSVLIHVVVPSHPVHVLFHFYTEALNPAFSHSGYDSVMIGDKKHLEAGDFFHQLHHRHVNCNYGTIEMPWDRLFGTFHDGVGIEAKRPQS